MTEIIVAIIAIIGIGVTASMDIIKDWYKRKFDRKFQVKELVDIDYKIHVQLEQILETFDATRATISRLHNGGVFFGGVPMEKFTMTHEVVDEMAVTELLQSQFQNQLLSRFAITFMKLFHNGVYNIPNVTTVKDVNLRMFLQKDNMKSIYFLLIRKLEDNAPIAFLALHYDKCTDLDIDCNADKKQELLLHRDKLAAFLSLSFQKFN